MEWNEAMAVGHETTRACLCGCVWVCVGGYMCALRVVIRCSDSSFHPTRPTPLANTWTCLPTLTLTMARELCGLEQRC